MLLPIGKGFGAHILLEMVADEVALRVEEILADSRMR